jgi:hypothetical protein
MLSYSDKPSSISQGVSPMSNYVLPIESHAQRDSSKNTSLFLLFTIFRMIYHESFDRNTPSIIRLFAAIRIVLFPNELFKFLSMNIMLKLFNPERHVDPLYFLAHRYHISRRFTLRQRVRAAIGHREYELNNFTDEYSRRVYRSDGILLWEHCHHKAKFTIVLVATDDNLHEGELSVKLYVDDIQLCRMSFCYINGSMFGLTSDMSMLISRIQTDRNSARDLFHQCFKQNKVQLFCLHAVCGIASANEFKTVLAIRHDAQIACDETYDAGFRNSYTALWETFDAAEIDRHVYRLDLPLKLPPLQSVNPTHRRRARERRSHWDDIMQSARSRTILYLMDSKSEGACSRESGSC